MRKFLAIRISTLDTIVVGLINLVIGCNFWSSSILFCVVSRLTWIVVGWNRPIVVGATFLVSFLFTYKKYFFVIDLIIEIDTFKFFTLKMITISIANIDTKQTICKYKLNLS